VERMLARQCYDDLLVGIFRFEFELILANRTVFFERRGSNFQNFTRQILDYFLSRRYGSASIRGFHQLRDDLIQGFLVKNVVSHSACLRTIPHSTRKHFRQMFSSKQGHQISSHYGTGDCCTRILSRTPL